MVLLLMLLLFLFYTHGVETVPAYTIKISPTEDPVTVWRSVDTLHKCNGIIDVPDIPVRVFLDSQNTTHMVDGSTTYRHMNGPSILNVTRSCQVAWNMTGIGDPSLFAGNEFLDSTFAFSNGTVVSLIHTEFPGNRYNYDCNSSYPYCWTVSIGLAVSHNFGNTWKHVEKPPHHLVAAVPYPYNQSQSAFGWGDPSNIVVLDNYYYFAMWNRNQIGLQPPGICIVRTSSLLDPSSFRGWNGKSFDVILNASPYHPLNNIDRHICTVVNLPTNCAALGLVWSAFLETFVTTLGCFGKMSRAFYFATSDNLIEWSTPQQFYSRDNLPPEVLKNITSIVYPTFVDPTAPYTRNDPNFYTIGQTPFLFWASLGHSAYTDGRSLWATKMKFTKERETTTLVEQSYV